jgi:NADH dehydrogenase
MQNIVVVGGTGFIGGAITDALRKRGHTVSIVSSRPDAANRGPGIRYGDMRRPETMDSAIADAQVLVQSVNFATYPFENIRKGNSYFTFDSKGTRDLVRVAKAAGVRRYIFVAGVGVSLDAPQPYFRAIAEGEKAVEDSGLEAVSLRPAFVYGPRDRGLNTIIRFARYSPFIPILEGGDQLHQPIFIDDVADAARQVVGEDAPQGKFDLAGPERLTLREMIEHALRIVGIKRPLVPVPLPLAYLGAAILEKLPYSLLTRSGIDFCMESFIARNDTPNAKLTLQSTPFERGLSSYLGRS